MVKDKMNFQYYENLADKSKDRLIYLLNYIAPKIGASELSMLLKNIETNKKKGKSKQNFIETRIDEEPADFTKLSEKQIEILFKIFISRELNDRTAVRWRFLQNFKYIKDFLINTLEINENIDSEDVIDIIIKTKERIRYGEVSFPFLGIKTS